MGSAHAGGGTVIEALGRGLPGDRLVVDPDVLAAISHDDAEWAPAGKAKGVAGLDLVGLFAGSVEVIRPLALRPAYESGSAVAPWPR
jgi:hypothetical protein